MVANLEVGKEYFIPTRREKFKVVKKDKNVVIVRWNSTGLTVGYFLHHIKFAIEATEINNLLYE